MLCFIFIYSDPVTPILMLTPLQKSHTLLYYDTKIIHIDFVVAKIYSIHFGHIIFKQGPEPEAWTLEWLAELTQQI